jgi:PAS domain S-box-containing protein
MKKIIKNIGDSLAKQDMGGYPNRLLKYLLLAGLASMVIIGCVNFWEMLENRYPEAKLYLLADLLIISVLVGLWFLNRRGLTRLASYIFLIMGLMVFFTAPDDHTFNNTVLTLVVPVMISSFLIKPVASIYLGSIAIAAYILIYILKYQSQSPVPFDFEWFSLMVLFLLSVGSWIIAKHYDQIVAEVKNSQQMFADLVDQLPAFVYIVPLKPGSRAIYISSHIETLTGFTPTEWSDNGERWSYQIHPDDRKRVISTFEKSQLDHKPYQLEYRLYTKDGRLIWVRDEAHILFSEQKQPVSLQGVMVDISQAKQSEDTLVAWRTALENQVVERTRELADTQDRLKLVLESSTDGYWEWDVPTGQVDISSSLAKMLGYEMDEIPAGLQYWSQLTHPEDLPGVQKAMSDHLEGRAPFYEVEIRLRRKNGDWLWIRDRGRIVGWDDKGRAKKIVGTHTDIHAHKQITAALQRREAVLEAVGFAATRFLSHVDWQTEMPAVLEQLSKALNIQQAAVIQFPNAPTDLLPFETYIPWPKSIVPERMAELSPEIRTEIQASLTEGMAPLFEGKVVISRRSEQPESWQKIMDFFQLSSNLLVPIFYQGKFWGAISFSDSDEERQWAAPEIEACRIAALTLEATLHNTAVLKALETSQENYRMLADNIGELISIIDLAGGVIFSTPSSRILFGISADEMPRQNGLELVHPDDLPNLMAIAREHLMGKTEPFTAVFRAIKADGSQFWMEAAVRPVMGSNDQPVTRLVAVCRDVTERKEAEEKLAERTAELSQANAELKRADAIKDIFLRNMSHDLRTPLSAILSVTEALQEQTYGPLTSRQDEALNSIQISGEHLKRLIDDAFDLSRLQAGMVKLDWQEVDIATICSQSMEITRQLAEAKQLELLSQIDPDLPRLRGDPLQLKRILVNLLGNAIKFTPSGGRVGLSVTCQGESDELHLTVWDTGIGISDADQKQLFRPFFQVRASGARGFTGSGLGLPLVKELAELHGGHVLVHSGLGEGSRFTICLPLPRDHAPNQPLDPQPRKILLIVDNPENTQILYSKLLNSGYDVQLMRAGPEAITTAAGEPPDVVLVDISLPGSRGMEVIQRLRQDHRTVHLPVLALPADSAAADRDCCLNAGANAVLARPFHTRHLLELIEKILLPANGN